MKVPNSESEEPSGDFDADKAVWDYRRVIADLAASTTDERRLQLHLVADAMRKAWADWQGEDSLYEMAFGEPWEWKDEPK